jgi:DNA-binding transcriptional ArsR family regulator
VLLDSRGGELPSGYLAKHFLHSWPTTTRHLRVLEDAGLVSVRRTGRSSIYRLERDRLREVVRGWFDHFAPYDPTQTWMPSGPRSTGR